ncbi:hypothetical protein [Pseudomonas aeruginosa]|uniref:hypothetical protein n=1 Tax=Pseudomonas aeruginosa TaxID=287 RepID=UPI000F54A80A
MSSNLTASAISAYWKAPLSGAFAFLGHWLKIPPADAAKVLGLLWGNHDVATVEQAKPRTVAQTVDARPREVWLPRQLGLPLARVLQASP